MYMMLHVAGIESYIRLHYMSLQLVFMYKHFIVMAHIKHSVEFIPYLTEKCSYMMTVHRQHKYPCIRILLEKRLYMVIMLELQMYTATAETLAHLNGTPTCVVMYGMMQQK